MGYTEFSICCITFISLTRPQNTIMYHMNRIINEHKCIMDEWRRILFIISKQDESACQRANTRKLFWLSKTNWILSETMQTVCCSHVNGKKWWLTERFFSCVIAGLFVTCCFISIPRRPPCLLAIWLFSLMVVPFKSLTVFVLKVLRESRPGREDSKTVIEFAKEWTNIKPRLIIIPHFLIHPKTQSAICWLSSIYLVCKQTNRFYLQLGQILCTLPTAVTSLCVYGFRFLLHGKKSIRRPHVIKMCNIIVQVSERTLKSLIRPPKHCFYYHPCQSHELTQQEVHDIDFDEHWKHKYMLICQKYWINK